MWTAVGRWSRLVTDNHYCPCSMTKQAVDDLWASFNAPEPTKPTSVATATPAMTATSHPSASTPAASTSVPSALPTTGPKSKAKMVKIKATYDFVGEKIE